MYVSAADIALLYPDDNGSFTPEIIDSAILAAETEFEGLVAPTITIPLEIPVPEFFKRLILNIVRFRLYPQGGAYNKDMYDSIIFEYKNTISILEKIKNGEITISGIQQAEKNAIFVSAPPPHNWSAVL